MEVVFLLFVLCCSSFAETGLGYVYDSTPFNRSSFPPGFIFGAASAAYQSEGAAFEGGRGPSIWDTYTHKFPEKIRDRSNGDVANDFYHLYKDDVKLLKHIGFDCFRFSISWSRVLPHGKLSKGVNREGIAFYNNVINDLLANDITPFVTLFHWDLPQALEDEYKGFLSHLVIDDFRNFSDLCFKEFGDRVKHWITINEPFIFTSSGYDGGITLVTHWFLPYSNTTLDIKAAQRALDFVFGWFMHPVVYGSYPRSMRFLVGDRLPKFTKQQSAVMKGSIDFLGLNYYTGNYAAHVHYNASRNLSSTKDSRTRLTTHDSKGMPIGNPTGVPIFFSYPKGLHNLLVYTKKAYNNPLIYITETGMGELLDNDTLISTASGINDPQRIDYFTRHIDAVRRAIGQGVNVKGFIAWSLLDNFEWGSGYTLRFGLCYVDRKNGLKRTPRKSAVWFRRSCLNKN